MISGVKIKMIKTHSDERGYFREILRIDDGLLKHIGQSSVSLTKPGLVKAFHWHKNQDETFYVLSGKAQVVLHDLRKDSKTCRQTNTLIMSEDEQKLLLIPRKVAHGYKVLGKKPLVMLYAMNKAYNKDSPDEKRIPHDDKGINFNWAKYK